MSTPGGGLFTPPNTGNVFDRAYSAVDSVDEIVTERIKDATETSDLLQQTVIETIDALRGVNLDFNAGPIPSPPNLDTEIDVTIDLPEITPISFGAITVNMPTVPVLETVPGADSFEVPEFVPSITNLTIPNAPVWTAPDAPPERPDVGDVALPDAPVIALPAVPVLDAIVVPDFDGLILPTFDATLPEFEGTPLVDILQWSEPNYHSEILDEVIDKLRTLWSGGSGLPPAVEQAMYERAASREDMIASRELDAVEEEFSSRGFTMPTGMQAARIDQIRQDLTVKKLALNRELTIKFAEVQIENIRFACQQAIAAENVYVNIFLNAAQRMFESARFRVESQINIYNAQVSLFNARMNAYQVQASVFDTQVRAELTKIEVFKAEIEAEIARGQINEQKVRAYTAQVQALQTAIEIYKAQMQGAQIETDVIRSRIEGYRADVQAYAERIQADKVRFDAYESQVKGETAKAGILDVEARAYASLIQGKASAADIDIKRAELVIQKNRSNIDAYIAALDAEKARIQAQSAVIQTNAQAYTANTQRYVAEAQAETAVAQLEVSAKEAELRSNIAFYQAQVQAYVSNMEQMMRQASLIIEALKAAGSLSSTLAAGAMAGVHVGATLSGGGSVSASGAFSESLGWSENKSVSENYNYEGT